MAGNRRKKDPLAWNVRIADDKGCPTPEFMRKWAQQGRINELPADIQAALDTLSTTRGVVIYRGVSAWAVLVPGTSGFFLKTLGAGTDPVWAATPTIQELLDGISTDQGTILFRGAADWVALAPGSAGQFLQTFGAAADPAWADVTSGGVDQVAYEAGGSIFFPLVDGDHVPILDGAGDVIYTEFVTTSGLSTTDDLPEGVSNLYFTAERAQDAVGAMVGVSLIYVDGTPLLARAALTGDVTAPQDSNATTLATVNGNVGSFGSATQTIQVTYNAKGLATAVANVTIAIPSTQVTDFTEAAQDATGAMVGASLVYVDATPLLARAALTGDITAPQNSNATTLATVNANVGSFGSTTQVMTQTVNAKGLTTAAANVAIAIPSTQVTDFTEAAQDATGAMVDSTLVYVDATPLLTRAALTGDVTAPQASNATTLATVNANVGSFGSATQVAAHTVNAKGLVTAASNVTIAIPSTQVTDFSEAVDDRVAALIINSATVTWTYNDGANTLSAAAVSDPASILARTFIGY